MANWWCSGKWNVSRVICAIQSFCSWNKSQCSHFVYPPSIGLEYGCRREGPTLISQTRTMYVGAKIQKEPGPPFNLIEHPSPPGLLSTQTFCERNKTLHLFYTTIIWVTVKAVNPTSEQFHSASLHVLFFLNTQLRFPLPESALSPSLFTFNYLP